MILLCAFSSTIYVYFYYVDLYRLNQVNIELTGFSYAVIKSIALCKYVKKSQSRDCNQHIWLGKDFPQRFRYS